ncbi:hypothetical protein [Sphingobium aquiterrae]|uniref:hypothetical protein n=1 Tax=Sphingobium aquiterrae TaxID=2038656 RepID=UPI003015D3F5
MRILGKIASTIIGTRIAAESGKAGLLGAAAGMVATRVITRSPIGALAIGGAYVAHKLWQKKKQIDAKGPHEVAVEDGLVKKGQPPLSAIPHRARYRKARPVTPRTPVRRRPARP